MLTKAASARKVCRFFLAVYPRCWWVYAHSDTSPWEIARYSCEVLFDGEAYVALDVVGTTRANLRLPGEEGEVDLKTSYLS